MKWPRVNAEPTRRTLRMAARRRRLETRLIRVLGGVGLGIMLLVLGAAWAVGREGELSEARQQSEALARIAESRLRLAMGGARRVVEMLSARLAGVQPASRANLLAVLLQAEPQLHGLGFSPPGGGEVSVHREGGELRAAYSPVQPSPPAGWSGPHRDAAGLDVYAFSAPARGGLGRVSATLGPEEIGDLLRTIPAGVAGDFLAVGADGRIAAGPEGIPALPDELRRAMGEGGTGILVVGFPQADEGEVPMLVAWSTEPATGLRLAFVRRESEILAMLLRLNLVVFTAAVLGGVVLLFLVVSVVRRLTGPLQGLMSAASRVAQGDLEARAPDSDIEELAEVFTAFNGMVVDLRKHVEELQEVTRRQERARRELEIAAEIQESFLVAAPLAAGAGFEVHGSCREAGEVGGDFFDYFPMPGGRLAFCLGDVSGKGVPAALVMAVCRTLVRACAHLDPDPARCLQEVNGRLCEGNRLRMFVTCLYGVLDPSTGEVRLCNAGHLPPMLLRHGGAQALDRGGNRPLGVRPDSVFRSQELVLERGEGICLFTDGVSEALNPAGELYGMERLEQTLRRVADRGAGEVVRAVEGEVAAFADGAPVSDDLTLLVLRRTPQRLFLDARLEEVERAQDWLEGLLQGRASRRDVLQLRLALEELLVNTIRHGLAGREEGSLALEAAVRDGRVELRLEDDGPAFDPTAPPEPEAPRRLGGWGLRLTSQAVEDLAWRREGERNVVTFARTLAQAETPSAANPPPSTEG